MYWPKQIKTILYQTTVPRYKKNYVCIAMNAKKFSFIFAVNCMWSSWGRWSSCSRSCGSGIRKRRRTIIRNSKHGGKKCSGSKTIKQYCNTKKCPGKINLMTSRSLLLIKLYLMYQVLIYLNKQSLKRLNKKLVWSKSQIIMIYLTILQSYHGQKYINFKFSAVCLHFIAV